MRYFLLPLVLMWATASFGGVEIKTYRDLVEFIKTSSAQSIDELLSAIKNQDPEFLYNVSLVYSSRSLQEASFQAPRVILFGRKDTAEYKTDNTLVLTFNSTGLGRDRLEVMEFNPTVSEFQFHEVIFPRDRNEIGAPIFEDEPKSCISCHGHGASAKPIWDTYPIWPGAYGSDFDNTARIGEKSEESRQFKAFLEQSKQLPRYRHLTMEAEAELGFPDILRLSRHPNAKLTVLLSQHNFKRAAVQAKAWPHYKELKYALLGSAAQCFDFKLEEYFPLPLRSQMQSYYPFLNAKVVQSAKRAQDDTIKRYFESQNTPISGNTNDLKTSDHYDTKKVANLEMIARFAGSSLANASMVFRPGTMEFATPQFGIYDFFAPLLTEAHSDPDFKTFFEEGGQTKPFPGNSYPVLNCSKLSALSLHALDSITALKEYSETEKTDEQAPVLRCMSCHTTPYVGDRSDAALSSPAPFYPFDRPVLLKSLLQANSGALADTMKSRIMKADSDPARMPKAPHKPLSTDERDALLSLIDRLSK